MATNTYICTVIEVCQGFLFLYVVTGCDTVSMFSGHGKKQPGKCGSHSQKQEPYLQGFSEKYTKSLIVIMFKTYHHWLEPRVSNWTDSV